LFAFVARPALLSVEPSERACGIASLATKALGAERIGYADAAGLFEFFPNLGGVVWGESAEAKAEAVSDEVAGFELISVPLGGEDFDAWAGEASEEGLDGFGEGDGDGDGLGGDGVSIFHASEPSGVGICAEGAGDIAHDIEGIAAGFTKREVEVFAFARGLVSGDFLDDKVFGAGADGGEGEGF